MVFIWRFYMIMRYHEDIDIQWWLRSTTGSYGWTCVETAYEEIMIHSTESILGDVSSGRMVGVSPWYIIHDRHTRVNTSVGTVYDIFFCFHDIKIYMYYILKSICIIKETLVDCDIVLAWRRSEKFSTARDFFF